MQTEFKVITAACGIFCITLILTMMGLPEEPTINEYCERVALYEQTKHLPERDILGHRNFKERQCN